MSICFDLKMFFFLVFEDFFYFWLLNSVFAQSIRDKFQRILHAASCRMIPGIAHFRPKEASHIDIYLKKTIFFINFAVFCYFIPKWVKTKCDTQNLSPGCWRGQEGEGNSGTHDTILAHFVEFLWRPGWVNKKWAPSNPMPTVVKGSLESFYHIEV